MKSSGKNGLNIRTNAREKGRDLTQSCDKKPLHPQNNPKSNVTMGQDQVSGGVSVLCWLAAPVAMFYGNLLNSVIRSKSVLKSSSVKIGVMSDQLRVSLYIVMSQNVM